MKNIISIFIPHKEISMTPEEKISTWSTISAQTFLSTELPVRKSIPSRLYYGGLLPALNRQYVSFQKGKYALGAVVGILIFSGGVSAFAQDALPGDLLYPIKVKVNEKLQVALALTPEQKASAEVVLATKRLEEAESLAIAGKLNPEIAEKTAIAFSEHVQRFESHLMELEKSSKYASVAKVGIFFQTRVAVHAAVLKDMEINSILLSSSNDSTKIRIETSGLEKKVLSATIPSAQITKKAVTTIKASSTATEPESKRTETIRTYENTSDQNTVSLNIDSQEAKDYLIQLHEDIGVAHCPEL